MMRPPLEAATLPADAVEVGRIHDAWGIKGFFKVIPHSASPEALFSATQWYLLPPERSASRPTAADKSSPLAWQEPLLMQIIQAKNHSDSIVASAQGIADRNAAETLKGARIWVSREAFPAPEKDEYYWVDLLGLAVRNREGVALGTVRDLQSTGAQTLLVLQAHSEGREIERLIPFVAAFVDAVDLPSRCITVDWQADY